MNNTQAVSINPPGTIKKRARKNKLTIKQSRFVSELPKSKTGTEAAIKAGYSENGASVRASELLGMSKIQAALIGAAPLAVQVLTNELNNDDADTRIKAADKILKYTPKTEVSASFDLEDLI